MNPTVILKQCPSLVASPCGLQRKSKDVMVNSLQILPVLSLHPSQVFSLMVSLPCFLSVTHQIRYGSKNKSKPRKLMQHTWPTHCTNFQRACAPHQCAPFSIIIAPSRVQWHSASSTRQPQAAAWYSSNVQVMRCNAMTWHDVTPPSRCCLRWLGGGLLLLLWALLLLDVLLEQGAEVGRVVAQHGGCLGGHEAQAAHHLPLDGGCRGQLGVGQETLPGEQRVLYTGTWRESRRVQSSHSNGYYNAFIFSKAS